MSRKLFTSPLTGACIYSNESKKRVDQIMRIDFCQLNLCKPFVYFISTISKNTNKEMNELNNLRAEKPG